MFIQNSIGNHIYTQTDSITVGNTASELTLVGTGVGNTALNANDFFAGRSLIVYANGYYTFNAASTLDLKIKLGATTILDTGAIALVAGVSNLSWRLMAIVTCRTTGSTGTIMPQSMGEFTSIEWNMSNVIPITIDTTVSQQFDLTAQWSMASALASITCTNLILSYL